MNITKYELHDHLVLELGRRYSEECGEPFLLAVGDSPAWDLCGLSGKPAIEVKAESTPSRTRNIVIEFWNSDLDKPSGILATSADLWVHIVPDGDGALAIEWEVDRLKKLAMESPLIKHNGRNSIFKLIPLEDFRKMAKRTFAVQSRFTDVNTAAATEHRGVGGF